MLSEYCKDFINLLEIVTMQVINISNENSDLFTIEMLSPAMNFKQEAMDRDSALDSSFSFFYNG